MKEENETSLLLKQHEPKGWKTITFILVNETFERVWSLGLPASIMVYLVTQYNMDQVKAATIISIWAGVTNLLPIFGAVISDSYIGRFRTIVFGSLIAIMGMTIVTLTAWVPQLRPQARNEDQCTNLQLSVLMTGLFLIGLGTGGTRSCSVPFSFDQLDNEEKTKHNFYSIYYTTQILLMLILQTIVVYIQTNISWFVGFALPTGLMFGSTVMLLVGSRRYVFAKPEGSVVSSVTQVFVLAYRNRRLRLSVDEEHDDYLFYKRRLKIGLVSNQTRLTNEFRFLNKAAIVTSNEQNLESSTTNPQPLRNVQHIENVKCLLKTVPISLTNIVCNLALFQQTSFATSQAMKMDRRVGPTFEIPSSLVSVVPFVAMATWLPLYGKLIIPTLQNITKQEGGITVLKRVGLGQVFAVLTMIFSGLVETKRRDLVTSSTEPDLVALMSVFWLTPQSVFVGLSQAFGMVGLTEFYNSEFPDNMRSIGNASLYLVLAASSYLNSIIIVIVQYTTRNGNGDGNGSWLTEDVDTSKLDYFYFFVAGITLLNFVLFVSCAKRYRYKSICDIS